MRTVSFIFAFAVLLLGPSMAGTSQTDHLPGIGTFDFGAPVQATAPVLMAAVR